MRALITGAGGPGELVRAFEGPGATSSPPIYAALDVGDRDATVGAITSLHPDIVVNAAARADVDACESDPDGAYRVNALGVRNVADGARRVGAHVVHISTDYVFDGTSPDPCSRVGRSVQPVRKPHLAAYNRALSERKVLYLNGSFL